MYNGKQLFEAIIAYDFFMKKYEESKNKDGIIGEQYGYQSGRSQMPKVVVKYKGKYRINETLRKSVEVAKAFEKEYGKPLPIIQEYLESNPKAREEAEVNAEWGMPYVFDEAVYIYKLNVDDFNFFNNAKEYKPRKERMKLLDRMRKDYYEYLAFAEKVDSAEDKEAVLKQRYEEQGNCGRYSKMLAFAECYKDKYYLNTSIEADLYNYMSSIAESLYEELEVDKVKLEKVLLAVNERYKEAQRNGTAPEEKELTRNFLLSLPTLGLNAKEMKVALVGALNDKTANPAVMPWERLQQAIYEKYMLGIGKEENPLIKPVFGCWLNVYTREISTVKPVDFFTEVECCVRIPDYRTIGGIDWKDIAVE